MASDKGYRQLLCSELGDSTLVADYSRFKVPDSTYFRDPEHLNTKGAQYFGEHIAREGLQLQYAIDLDKGIFTYIPEADDANPNSNKSIQELRKEFEDDGEDII